jgi:hypothetical protein
MDTQDRPSRSFRPGALLGGVVLLTVGVGLLLDRSGLVHVQAGHLVAPMVLIVLGAIMTFERGGFVYSVPVKDDNGDVRFHVRQRRSSGAGLWLIGIGVWMLISQNHLWGFTFETSWPLFVIFMGVMMVFRGWR